MSHLLENEQEECLAIFNNTFPTFNVEQLCYDVDQNVHHNKVPVNVSVSVPGPVPGPVPAHDRLDETIYAILPIGVKVLLWYTKWKNNNVAILYPFRNKSIDTRNILLYKALQATTNPNEVVVGKGTVLIGTLFHYNRSPYFSCDNLFYAANQNVFTETFRMKLTRYQRLFSHIRLHMNCKVNVGLPVMYTTYAEALNISSKLPYGIYGIQLQPLDNVNKSKIILKRKNGLPENPLLSTTSLSTTSLFTTSTVPTNTTYMPEPTNTTYMPEPTNTIEAPTYGYALPPTKRVKTSHNKVYGCPDKVYANKVYDHKVYDHKVYANKVYANKVYANKVYANKVYEAVFIVKATLDADMYDLYVQNAAALVKYGSAMIPTYKRSVMLNKLFRHIKENFNLDCLEESDTEEEFEDMRENKYVDLEKTLSMRCIYVPRFRKWEPVHVVEGPHHVITLADAQRLGPT
jgi:hypothetical protein